MRQLESYIDGDKEIQIMESLKDGSRYYFHGGALYTHIDRTGGNLLDYVNRMLGLLKGAKEVLLLGTAGGALASELCRRGSRVTAVDDCSRSFEVARRWFHLPSHITCVHAEAAAFLRSATVKWDAVAVDVYRGFEIPDGVLSEEVAESLLRAVRPGGLIVWNVAADPGCASTERVRNTLKSAGLTPRCLQSIPQGEGNTMVVCRSPI
jgi:spermidine synthase